MTSTAAPAIARRDVVVGLGVAAIAALVVALGWLLPASSSPAADALGVLQVGVASGGILALLAIVGASAASALPARVRHGLPLGLLLAIGATAIALPCLLEHAITGQVLVAPFAVVGVAAVAVVVRLVRAVRGATPGSLRVALRARVGARATSLDVVAIALAGVAMLPVARHGLTAWTLGILDWHRYAGSVLVWLDGEAAFLASHPDEYGASQALRAGFEKPAVTALLVAMTRLTGIHPVGLLTPFLLVMLIVLVTSAMALVRIAFAASPRTSVLVAVPATLSAVVMLPIAQAQPGGLAAAALLVGAVASVALVPTVATHGEAARVGLVAGAILAVAVASNATLSLSAMPVALALAGWVVLRWRMPRRLVVTSVGAAAHAAAVVLLPQAGRFARSLVAQVDGSAGIAIPLVSPAGVVGLEVAGGVPGLVAVAAWVVVVVAILGATWRWRRTPDAAGALVVTATFALSLAGLGVVYGIDGYSTAKWLGVAAPLAVPPLLAAGVGALMRHGVPVPQARAFVAPVLAGAVGVVAVLAASPLTRVQLVLPASTMQLAASEALAAQPIVNVDLDGGHRTTLVPLLVPTAVVSMDATYASAQDPVGDAFLVDAEAAVGRDWLTSQEVAPGLVAGTLDLDVGDEGLSLLEPGASDHLFGGWLGRDPQMTLLDEAAGEAFVVLDVDVDAVPDRLVVTGYTEGPATVVLTVGDETVAASPEDGVLMAVVPVDAAAIVDGRIVVRVEVVGDGSGARAVARIDGVEWDGGR